MTTDSEMPRCPCECGCENRTASGNRCTICGPGPVCRRPKPMSHRGTTPGQPNTTYIEEERDRLVRAHFENACGDYACMRRRADAAIQVLTGWPKGHGDVALAVEMWDEEVAARLRAEGETT